MSINIKFDLVGNPEPPTIILATRNGNKLGQLDVDIDSIELTDKFNDASEFTFTLHKFVDGKITNLWDKVVNFKLVYCKEWDTWFEVTVELDEETETIKTVFCTQLGQAELSQLMLYNIEINTEEDIERDDYKISILYDADNPDASILHRLLKDKAPHYSIIHVDSTVAKIQRMFSFDGTSIYDAFQEIAEEIGCLFVFHSDSDENGRPRRVISVFDLESNCNDCGHRDEFTRVCPKCGSTNINEGYGDDTTIFVTADELADNIQLTTDTDAVKNCFKLEAGDDLMTATIRNCNPNGTDYIWYISDATKADMSPELVAKLESYDNDYKYYQKDYVAELDSSTLERYNALVKKYQAYNEELEKIRTPIVGYPAIIKACYNTIDLELYLESALMPSVDMSGTDANTEARNLISGNLSPVSAENIEHISLATADNIVLSMAKILVDPRYKVKIHESSFDENTKIWTGDFEVTSYSDEEDTAISGIVNVVVNDDYKNFVQQKIEKLLNKEDTDDLSISGLFEKSQEDFELELKKYSLNCLKSFHNACQSCIDILIEQGVGNKITWSGKEPNLYDDLYVVYLNKLSAIEYELSVRQDEIDLIIGVYDANGDLKTYGLQNYIEEAQSFVHSQLDFEKYLGVELWNEFCSFRREDKYSNDNYISDGLSNTELFDNALKFIEVAEKEIFKSAELQHSISSTLKNLLAIKKFAPLVKSFKNGNWLRVLIDDEIYKLRLIEYTINYGDFNNIKVEFSDVAKPNSTIKSVQDVFEQAAKMATSYSSVQKQAEQGSKGKSILNGWSQKGMDVTNTKIIQGANNQSQTWDEHGMLFRKYDPIIEDYNDTQLKIVNSTMAITDDNWNTVKTAVGEYYYFHPETGKMTKAYGVNAEVLVGNLILGEQLGIYNENGSLKFNNDGFEISNEVNSFKVNPNDDILLSISRGEEKIFYVDDKGRLYISGDGSGIDISGTVVISGLADGTTVIDGGCIQTGTIEAARLNLTGAITWSDLSYDVINRIPDLPDYLQSTYIDGTMVSAPILRGGTVSGAKFSNLGQTTWLEVGKDSGGADNDAYGLSIFSTRHDANSSIFSVWNADAGWTSFSGKNSFTFMTTDGYNNTVEPYGTWDFSGATTRGLYLTFS